MSGRSQLLRGLLSAFAVAMCVGAPSRGLTQPQDAASATSGISRQLPAPAGAPRSDSEAEALAAEVNAALRCPTCQGLSVADSPAESARDVRIEVLDLAKHGYSKQQIMDYFESTYGEFVLLTPKPEGLNLLVWIGPAALILAGLLVVWRFMRRRSASPQDEGDLESYLEQVRREVGS